MSETSSISYTSRRRHRGGRPDYSPTRSSRHHERSSYRGDQKAGYSGDGHRRDGYRDDGRSSYRDDEKSDSYHAGAVVHHRRDDSQQQVRRLPRAPSPAPSWGEPGYEEYDLRGREDYARQRQRARERERLRKKKRTETGILLAVGLAVVSLLLCFSGSFDRKKHEEED